MQMIEGNDNILKLIFHIFFLGFAKIDTTNYFVLVLYLIIHDSMVIVVFHSVPISKMGQKPPAGR